MYCAVTGNAGVVDQDFDWAQVLFDLTDSSLTGIEIGNVDFVYRDTGFILEFFRSFVVSAVYGGDCVALSFNWDATIPPIPRVPPVTTATLDI